MRSRRLSLLMVFAIGICSPTFGQGYNSKGGSHRGYNSPYTQQEQQASAWSGSGIALGPKVFATNNHVVNGATHLYVYFPDTKSKYAAQTICVDSENDLALVRITDSRFNGFPEIRYGFKKATEDVGTSVFVLGYPRVDTMGEEVKLTTGVLSSRSGYQGNPSQYQMSAAVQPGNSGGPLFNNSGELIGIVSAKHSDGAENVSYAVKLSYLEDLVSRSGENITLSRSSQISSIKLSEQCKVVIPCTVMVLADNEREGHPRLASSSYGASERYPIHVNAPAVTETNTNFAGIIGIEFTERYTALFMTVINPTDSDTWYNIDKGTYLLDKATGEKFFIKETENCEIAPKRSALPADFQEEFVLYFQPAPATIATFDFVEPSGSGWLFSGIQIR